ncbi:hypothetical protein ACFL07_03240 [Pseudomonadota bacterium]
MKNNGTENPKTLRMTTSQSKRLRSSTGNYVTAVWIHALAWLAIILISGAFILFGLIQWPGLHWDASLFATPVLNVASGKGWQFGGFTPLLLTQSSEDYSFHGVLHVQIFGYLLGASTFEKLFLWSGMVNAATFVIWTFLFHRTLHHNGRSGLIRPILFGLMAGVIALGLQGRPEQLALLLVAIPLILREFSAPIRIFQISQYVLIGLLFTLSPASGVLYGMGILFWLSFKYENHNNRLLWRELIVAGLIASAVPVLIVGLFCPFSVREWITNILFATKTAMDFSGVLFKLDRVALTGGSLYAPLWTMTVSATAGLMAFYLLTRRKFFGFVTLVLLALYCYPRLYDYGYVAFFPLIFLFWLSRSESTQMALAKPAGKELVMHIGTVIATLYTLVIVRLALLSILFIQQGESIADTKQKFKDLGIYGLHEGQAAAFNVQIRPSFIVFGDGGDRFISGKGFKMNDDRRDKNLIKYEEKYQRKIEYFIYPQSYRGQPTDAFYVGQQQFELVYNGWTSESPRFLGIKLGGPMPGYQFALYRREQTLGPSPILGND